MASKQNQPAGRMGQATSLRAWVVASALIVAAGCDVKSFIDPSEVGRYERKPLLMPILDRLDTGVEESNEQFAKAEDAKAEDLVAINADYVLGKTDVITVTITDLNGIGVDTVRTVRISESGLISLPLIKQLMAEGLTEAQLEEAIAQAYADAQLLPNAQVTVQIAAARARTFSLLGAVQSPGEYEIPRADFRVLDALVTARDFGVPGQEYLYVIRKPMAEVTETPSAAPSAPSLEGTNPDIYAPQSKAGRGGAAGKAVAQKSPAQDVAGPEAQWRIDLLQPRMLQVDGSASPEGQPPATSQSEIGGGVGSDADEGRYVVIDGRPVRVGESPTTQDALGLAGNVPAPLDPTTLPDAAKEEFNFDIPPASGERIIRVPLQALRSGELRHNIVIRPGDLLVVPPASTGVYYMGGHVQRTGVYTLPIDGTRMTLKQAIIGAGMLDAVAIPQRTDVIRRIGTDREVFARVDLDAIFSARQPDIFLKPNDTVMVGTNFFAPFLAAIRGGFRFSYGFGFLYDRNYGDEDNQNN